MCVKHISTNSGRPRPPYAVQLAGDSLVVRGGGGHNQRPDRRGSALSASTSTSRPGAGGGGEHAVAARAQRSIHFSELRGVIHRPWTKSTVVGPAMRAVLSV